MAASVPTPVSPQTHEFILSIPEEVLLKILRSAKVKLSVPAHGILPRAELEKRVKLLLSDCQRLKEVLPLGSVSYTQLPEWVDGGMGDKSDKNQEGKESSSTDTLVDAFSSSIYTIKESLELQCMKDYMPELVEHQAGEHAFADLGYSLLGLAGGIRSLLDCQIADRAFFLQDKAQTSAIAISLVSLRGCSGDPTTPVLFVLFDHETRKHLVNTSSLVDVKTISATQRWVQSVLNGGQAIGCIDCPVNAQHLLLRQLLYNSRRLPTEIKSVFSRARRGPLVHFTASFIVPLRPVSPTALGYLSLPLCRAPCSAPKCPGTLGTGGICSGCSVTEYCSTACQSHDRARHAPECRRIASSKFVSFEPVPFGGSGRFESQITLSFNMTARDVIGNSKSQSPADQLKAGLAASRRKRPGGRLFVIKIQCGMGDRAPLMIYDQDRTFSFHLSHPGFLKMLGWSKDDSPGDKRDAEAFEALETLARNCTRWRGLKVFLWARHSRSSDARLEVLTEISPSQEIPW